jgi:hypothetical protein
MQDLVFGRFFTDRSAPTTEQITKEFKATKKGKSQLQIDCGQNTEDLNVLVTNLANPHNPNEQSYLKSADFRCFKPPEEPGSFSIQAITSKGIIRTTYPKE